MSIDPSKKLTNPTAITSITAADMPLHCPTAAMPVWNQHPKVYLELDGHGHAKCPYCGTEYQMSGAFKAGH